MSDHDSDPTGRPTYLTPITDAWDLTPPDDDADPGYDTYIPSPTTNTHNPDGTHKLHDETTERHILAALLTRYRDDPTASRDIIDTLKPTDFHNPHHATIYDAILGAWAKDGEAHTLNVIANLTNSGQLRTVQRTLATITNPDDHHDAPSPTIALQGAHRLLRFTTRRDGDTIVTALANTVRHGDDHELHTRLTEIQTQLARINHDPTTPDPEDDSWTDFDIANYNEDDDTEETPTILTLTDGTGLLYPGKVHSLSAEPGTGKSWAAILATAQQILAGNPVTYIDFEDRYKTFHRRMRAIGVNPKDHAHLIHYIRPSIALDTTRRTQLLHTIEGSTLVTLDGITEAMSIHGWSYIDNEDVARFLLHIPRALSDIGAAVLQIDHVTKNADTRGRYAIGGQHKLAGLDGVAYKLIVTKAPAKGRRGTMRLVVDKDRPGTVGPAGYNAAELVLDSTDPTGPTRLWLQHAAAEQDETGEFRPTGLMQKVSEHVQLYANCSGKNIEEHVKGKGDHVRQAIRMLEKEGYITIADGPRGSRMHLSLMPYTEEGDRS